MKTRLLAIFLFLGLMLAGAVQAAPGQEARAVLEKAINSILEDIRSPAFANAATRQDVIRKIENSVRTVFDFGEFSSRTVGARWRTFSPEEKKRFEEAFANLLFTTYLNKITGYNGETVQYTGETVNKEGTRVEIKSVIVLGDGRKVPVAYRMLPKNGSWVIYDVLIENISLVQNYRTQFQDILKSATPDQLAARVEERARELMRQGEANGK